MAVDRFNQQSRSKVTVSLITGGLGWCLTVHGSSILQATMLDPGEEQEGHKENERRDRGREEKGEEGKERERIEHEDHPNFVVVDG